MKKSLTHVLLIVLLLSGFTSSWAQCIPLQDLLALRDTNPTVSPDDAGRFLPAREWTFSGPWQESSELYWAYDDPEDDYVSPDGLPEAWLGLRPANGHYNVVLKTNFKPCIARLRAELRSRKLVPEAVTCPNCEGTRYVDIKSRFSVYIYDKKKGPYPVIIVVRYPISEDTKPATSPSASAASLE